MLGTSIFHRYYPTIVPPAAPPAAGIGDTTAVVPLLSGQRVCVLPVFIIIPPLAYQNLALLTGGNYAFSASGLATRQLLCPNTQAPTLTSFGTLAPNAIFGGVTCPSGVIGNAFHGMAGFGQYEMLGLHYWSMHEIHRAAARSHISNTNGRSCSSSLAKAGHCLIQAGKHFEAATIPSLAARAYYLAHLYFCAGDKHLLSMKAFSLSQKNWINGGHLPLDGQRASELFYRLAITKRDLVRAHDTPSPARDRAFWHRNAGIAFEAAASYLRTSGNTAAARLAYIDCANELLAAARICSEQESAEGCLYALYLFTDAATAFNAAGNQQAASAALSLAADSHRKAHRHSISSSFADNILSTYCAETSKYRTDSTREFHSLTTKDLSSSVHDMPWPFPTDHKLPLINLALMCHPTLLGELDHHGINPLVPANIYEQVLSIVADGDGIFASSSQVYSQLATVLHQYIESLLDHLDLIMKKTTVAVLCAKIFSNLNNLQSGEGYVTRGGWVNAPPPGHSLAYHFLKQPNDLFSIMVYGTATSTPQRTRSPIVLDENSSERMLPCCLAYQNVPISKLPTILQRLLDLLDIRAEPTVHNFADVEAVFADLEPKPMDDYPSDSQAMQKSGSCASKALNCMISAMFGRVFYKRFNLEVRLQTLIYCYGHTFLQAEATDKNVFAFIMEEAASNFLRILNKNHDRQICACQPPQMIMSEMEFIRAKGIAEKILADVRPFAALTTYEERDQLFKNGARVIGELIVSSLRGGGTAVSEELAAAAKLASQQYLSARRACLDPELSTSESLFMANHYYSDSQRGLRSDLASASVRVAGGYYHAARISGMNDYLSRSIAVSASFSYVTACADHPPIV